MNEHLWKHPNSTKGTPVLPWLCPTTLWAATVGVSLCVLFGVLWQAFLGFSRHRLHRDQGGRWTPPCPAPPLHPLCTDPGRERQPRFHRLQSCGQLLRPRRRRWDVPTIRRGVICAHAPQKATPPTDAGTTWSGRLHELTIFQTTGQPFPSQKPTTAWRARGRGFADTGAWCGLPGLLDLETVSLYFLSRSTTATPTVRPFSIIGVHCSIPFLRKKPEGSGCSR